MNERFAILVIWKDGEEEYLKEGTAIARFSSRKKAVEQTNFMQIGMEDDCQSINVVPYPCAASPIRRRAANTNLEKEK